MVINNVKSSDVQWTPVIKGSKFNLDHSKSSLSSPPAWIVASLTFRLDKWEEASGNRINMFYTQEESTTYKISIVIPGWLRAYTNKTTQHTTSIYRGKFRQLKAKLFIILYFNISWRWMYVMSEVTGNIKAALILWIGSPVSSTDFQHRLLNPQTKLTKSKCLKKKQSKVLQCSHFEVKAKSNMFKAQCVTVSCLDQHVALMK